MSPSRYFLACLCLVTIKGCLAIRGQLGERSLDGSASCGNSVLEDAEECDDGNSDSLDGCSASCDYEDGFSCTTTTSTTCVRCPVGYYCIDGGQTPCTPTPANAVLKTSCNKTDAVYECPAGYGSDRSGGCQACTVGVSYSKLQSAISVSCTVCSAAPANAALKTSCDATNDAVYECPAGTVGQGDGTCVKCLDGSTFASSPSSTSSSGSCTPCTTILPDDAFLKTNCTTTTDTIFGCLKDFSVTSSVCTACPMGSSRDAGDNPRGPNTVCQSKICSVDEYVKSNVCTPCASGYGRSAGDFATGSDTVCAKLVCTTTIPASLSASGPNKYVAEICPFNGVVLLDCSEPYAGEYVKTPCVIGSLTTAGTNSDVQVCTATVPDGSYLKTECIRGSSGSKGSDNVIALCDSTIPTNAYVKTACVKGSFSSDGITKTFVQGYTIVIGTCSSPGTKQYVSVVCKKGTISIQGSDTVIASCSEPPAGEYVTSTCDSGSWALTGTDTITALCKLNVDIPIGSYQVTPCDSGSSISTGKNTEVASCPSGFVCSGFGKKERCKEPADGQFVEAICTAQVDTDIVPCYDVTGHNQRLYYYSKPCVKGSHSDIGKNSEADLCTNGDNLGPSSKSKVSVPVGHYISKWCNLGTVNAPGFDSSLSECKLGEDICNGNGLKSSCSTEIPKDHYVAGLCSFESDVLFKPCSQAKESYDIKAVCKRGSLLELGSDALLEVTPPPSPSNLGAIAGVAVGGIIVIAFLVLIISSSKYRSKFLSTFSKPEPQRLNLRAGRASFAQNIQVVKVDDKHIIRTEKLTNAVRRDDDMIDLKEIKPTKEEDIMIDMLTSNPVASHPKNPPPPAPSDGKGKVSTKWVKMLESETKRVYYYNTVTHESAWKKPSDYKGE